MSGPPKKGEKYKHPILRGFWTVRSAGAKETILDCNIPGLKPTVVPTQSFIEDQNWQPIPSSQEQG